MFHRILTVTGLTALCLAAQTVDRTKPPQTAPIPGYKLPPVYETKLPNGLGLILVEDARFPLVTARLNFQAGSKFDPKDMPGLAEAVAALLNEGTAKRTSRQISEEADSLGGAVTASAGADALVVNGSALAENVGRLLTLMADIAMNANFPQDEVALYQQNRTQALLAQRSEPSFLASEKFSELVYGSSPYAHIAPTAAAIQKLNPKVLSGFRDTYLVPNNATLVLLGKLPARETLVKQITAEFGAWKQKSLPAAPKMDTPSPKRQIVLVDRPGSVQADIHAGRLAPTRTSDEYFPLYLATNILGGGTNSRMFKNIREKEGFAYDAHTEYDTHREAGDFQAVTQVRNEVVEPALKAVISEMDLLAGKPVPSSELSDTKNYLAGTFLLRMETQDGVANQLNNMITLALPKNYLETWVTRVRSVEPDQIEAVAKKYVAPGESAIVVVGDASKIGDILKKFGEVTVTKAN